MSYADKSEMLKRYDERDIQSLTDRDNSGSIDDEKLQTALDDASAEIDGFLQKRVTLPLANPPQSLTAICCTIAWYNLQKLRGRATEDAIRVYDRATKRLASVMEGELGLGDETSGEGETSSPGSPQISQKGKSDLKFSDTALDGY